MTFPEAGIQVLERAGRPLQVQEIVAQAIQEGLLSHVGQIPEQTMRERLFALARRSADRKLVVVGPGQFALIDWGLPEDPEALAALENPEARAEEKPLRGKERHPPISKGGARSDAGREAGAGRNKKKRRLPPLSAVAAELLGDVGTSLDLDALLGLGREKGLMSDDLSGDTLLNALAEENRRRAKAGAPAMFEIENREVRLVSTEPIEAQRAAPEDVGTDGRERAGREGAAASGHTQALESRRQVARQVRRRIQELSNGQIERLALLLLNRSGYRDARPVRPPGSEHEKLFVVRRKLGLTEFRFLCQVLPVGREVSREGVQLLREWLPDAEAHAGMFLGPGEATREARAEAQRLGQPLLSLLCGDAFVEEVVLRQVGVLTYEATVVDDVFWRNFRRNADARAKSEVVPRQERSQQSPAAAEGRAAGDSGEGPGPASEEGSLSTSGAVQSTSPGEAAAPASEAMLSPAELPLGEDPE